jgi:hypothetical protein
MRWNFFPIFDVLVRLKELFSTPANAALVNLTVYVRELACAGVGRKQLRRHDGEEDATKRKSRSSSKPMGIY